MIETMPDVLLVEDNPADIELTLDILKGNRLADRVKVLRSGQEALDFIFKAGSHGDWNWSPRLILLELHPPEIDGLEILRRIRTNDRTRLTPVVVLTSSLRDEDRIASYSLGVNSYVIKPVNFSAFSRTITEIGTYWVLLNESPSP